MNEKLATVIEKYRFHPEFLGIEIIDPNQPGAVDDRLLHIAARTGATEDIDVLLSCGADVNVRGDLGNTPLHQAAMFGKANSVGKLLEYGADGDVLNEYGQTPADVAELGGHTDLAKMLRK